MKYLYFILMLLPGFVCSQNILSETDIEDDEWYKIYSSSRCTLYVKFEFPPNGQICKGASTTKFYYRYKGLESTESYAVWELDYLDCGGITKKMTAYAPLSNQCDGWDDYDPGEEFNFRIRDESITSKKILELRGLNNTTLNYMSPSIVQHTVKESIKPERLTTSKKTVRLGEKIRLSIEGGSLGEAAQWVVYDGACGGMDEILRSTSRDFDVLTNNSTTLYVRAEGNNNTTECVQIDITVDKSSTPPSYIEGETEICEGSQVNLKQVGGILGPNSEWYWYTDACGGNFVHKGSQLELSPKKTTIFYVRSQSDDGTEIGKCIEKKVSIVNKPKNKFELLNKTGQNDICEGDEVLLKADGELEDGCSWKWTKNGNYLSSRSEIKQRPRGKTVYKLQKVSSGNICPPSETFKNLEINVYKRSITPTGLYQKFDSYKKNKSQIIIEGGKLAKKSKWSYFFFNNKGQKVEIASTDKENIEVENGWSGKTLFVQAKGSFCNDSTPAISTSEVIKRKERSNNSNSTGFALNYNNSKNKFFHFGFQIGLKYVFFNDSISKLSYPSEKIGYSIQSLSYFFGGELHPVFLDQFYFGVHGGYGAFFKNYYNFSSLNSPTNNNTISGSGSIVYYGAEMGWTVSRMHAAKMFLKYTRTSYKNNLNLNLSYFDNNIGGNLRDDFFNHNEIVIDKLSLGFRFGAFDSRGNTGKNGNPRLGNHLDVMFNFFYRDNYNHPNIFYDYSSFSKITDWYLSYEMQYWIHNAIRIGFQLGSNIGFDGYNGNFLNYFTIDFAYNFDLFR